MKYLRPAQLVSPLLSYLMLFGWLIGCSATGRPESPSTAASSDLRNLFDDSEERRLELDPISALSRGDQRWADQFGDYISKEYFSARHRLVVRDLSRLATIDQGSLDATDQIAYDVFRFQRQLEADGFDSGVQEILRQLPLDHLFGYHITFPDMSSGQSVAPFTTVDEYQHGLQRFDGFVTYLQRARDAMSEGINQGHVLPYFAAELVLGQLDAALEAGVDGSPLLRPTTNFPDSIAEAEQDRLTEAYRTALERQVLPAYTNCASSCRRNTCPLAAAELPGYSP